jgi:hypothetical protein
MRVTVGDRPAKPLPRSGGMSETGRDAGDKCLMSHNPAMTERGALRSKGKCCRAASVSSDAARPAARVGLPPGYS